MARLDFKKHASHESYYCYKGCFMYREVKYRFSQSHNFRKFTGTGFWCAYDCIKRDKTDSIASIPMKF